MPLILKEFIYDLKAKTYTFHNLIVFYHNFNVIQFNNYYVIELGVRIRAARYSRLHLDPAKSSQLHST